MPHSGPAAVLDRESEADSLQRAVVHSLRFSGLSFVILGAGTIAAGYKTLILLLGLASEDREPIRSTMRRIA